MKTSKKKGKSTKPAQGRSHDEVTAAAGCAIFLMAGSGTALAQDQAASPSYRRHRGSGRHRYPQEHPGFDRRQEGRIVDRRGGLGRGHRQAAGCFDRRVDRPAARHCRAAHQRSRADAVDPRPRARLHRHDLQRPRAGLDQRQPHGRIRPVPVGARARRSRSTRRPTPAWRTRASRARRTSRPCIRLPSPTASWPSATSAR